MLVNAWQFDNGHEVVALLEDIDRRKTSHAGRAATHPIALFSCVDSSLYTEERLERINEVSHGSTP